ncbi:hypothetical protein [Oryzibacter oryziterrae]|uniref:hypothetical protein n=1 Tax=Oryzibacter oryziterrae TaxID=2766474 RepID=UPI001F274C9B|nr:hypothetical protein [Oryzibacter oryziterrae]
MDFKPRNPRIDGACNLLDGEQIRIGSSSAMPAARPWKMGFHGCGDSLALDKGVQTMRFKPWKLEVMLSKTADRWSITIRLSFKA